MENCHEDMLAYHNEDVSLPDRERTEMRDRRDTNRRRLKDGLQRDGEPEPLCCRSQGSYSMWTMVQQSDKDYDVDDGVQFDREKLKGQKGGDKTPADAKEMVRKALHDESFERPPEVRKNCVRIYYSAGYHVDMPVYRQVTGTNTWGQEETWLELASTDWQRSNPQGVTDWFLEANKDQSPDLQNGGQLRRVVRLLKAFARSRPSWRERIATGFMITKLVVERYVASGAREDVSLYDTMAAIRDRLSWDLEIEHPTVDGEKLTRGPDDGRSKLLRDKLDWALDQLQILHDPDCSREQALRAWDKVFNTTFFSERLGEDEAEAQEEGGAGSLAVLGAGVAAGLLIMGAKKAAAKEPVDKRGGGRYA